MSSLARTYLNKTRIALYQIQGFNLKRDFRTTRDERPKLRPEPAMLGLKQSVVERLNNLKGHRTRPKLKTELALVDKISMHGFFAEYKF